MSTAVGFQEGEIQVQVEIRGSKDTFRQIFEVMGRHPPFPRVW